MPLKEVLVTLVPFQKKRQSLKTGLDVSQRKRSMPYS